MNPLINNIDNVDSTNNYLQNFIGKEATLPNGYAVVSFCQEKGRGQRGNSWESEPNKNIALSILFRFNELPAHNSFAIENLKDGFGNLPIQSFFIISQIVSIAICQVLNCYLSDCRNSISIKWPNDIYCGDKKIAGILIENKLKGNSITHSIVGIGLNVNQILFKSDAPNPISMKQLTGNDFALDELTEAIYISIMDTMASYFANQQEILINSIYKRLLYRANGYFQYQDNNGIFVAQIVDVLPDGHLALQLRDSDEIRHYAFKEVCFLP